MPGALGIKELLKVGGDDAIEDEIIGLTNQIAKKDLRLIAMKTDEVSSFDEARIVVAYKQGSLRSKSERRQAEAGVKFEGLDPAEVEKLATMFTELVQAKDELEGLDNDNEG